MTIGVILAGGRGMRFGESQPKQFHPLAGRPILSYAIEAFAMHPQIEELIVIFPIDFAADIEEIVNPFRSKKPISLVPGGDTRAASTRAALAALPAESERRKILFHDGVRPFVTADIISRSIAALDNADAVDVVVETADTIVRLEDDNNLLSEIPPRARLRRGQTPQGFWTDQLAAAYARLDDNALSRFTDDCGVLLAEKPDAQIAAIMGADTNLKITSKMDLFLAEQVLYTGFSGGGSDGEKAPVVVILGGSSGLGRATADYMETLGWSVFSTSRSMGVDVRDEQMLTRYLDGISARHGHIDLVANLAGILHVGPIIETPADTIAELLEINLNGSINVARAAYPHLKKSSGHLILTSSSSYYRGRRNTAVYSASKAAVVNLTQALADEWSDGGVAVSCIVPRRADTPMRRKAFPNEDPGGNLQPEAVALAIVEMFHRRLSGVIRSVY